MIFHPEAVKLGEKKSEKYCFSFFLPPFTDFILILCKNKQTHQNSTEKRRNNFPKQQLRRKKVHKYFIKILINENFQFGLIGLRKKSFGFWNIK